jgi:LysM repeat protein
MGFVLAGCASSKSAAPAPAPPTAVAPEELQKPSPNNILKTAFSQVGTPYRYGGASPTTGFDCSGFVKWVYGQYDIRLPRSSGDMITAGQVVDRRELKPGDLVFFGRRKRITHVGIYTGDDKFIHSPRTGKSIEESPLAARARGEYFVGARRILPQVDVDAIDDELKQMWIAQAGQPEDAPAALTPAGPSAAIALTQWMGLVPPPPPASGAAEAGSPATLAHVMQTAVIPTLQTAAIAPAAPADVQTAEAQPAVAAAPAQTAAKAATAKKHRVASGDTLYGVARKYKVSGAALVKANKMSSEKAVLRIGQMLIIPAQASAPTPVQVANKPAPAQATVPAEKQPSAGQAQTAPSASAEQAQVADNAAQKPAPKTAPATAQKSRQHKVASGDTLYDLARKYGTSTEALAKANKLDTSKKNLLKLGQVLIVPL